MSRNTWINLVSVAVLLVVAGLIVASRPVHATFTEYTETTAFVETGSHQATVACITPLNSFLGRDGPQYSGQPADRVAVEDYNNADDACGAALAGRGHIVWTIIFLAVIPLGILAVLALRRPALKAEVLHG